MQESSGVKEDDKEVAPARSTIARSAMSHCWRARSSFVIGVRRCETQSNAAAAIRRTQYG